MAVQRACIRLIVVEILIGVRETCMMYLVLADCICVSIVYCEF